MVNTWKRIGKATLNSLAAIGLLAASIEAQPIPKLPIGMNIHGQSYYAIPIFTNAMKSSGPWMTFHATGDSPWNTGLAGQMPSDSNGYPLEIPFSAGDRDQVVRCMLNDFYQGEYALLYDGDGDLAVGGRPSSVRDGVTYIAFTGRGEPIWLDIRRSAKANPVRNLRILPSALAKSAAVPTFLDPFLKGLRPMRALRFMDLLGTNGSPLKHWSDRPRKGRYTFADSLGAPLELAIELANELKADAWVCIPHQADADYILQVARLVKANLDPSLKVYVEYSNEIWNWGFTQASYVGKNAPGGEATVSNALRQVGKKYCNDAESFCHPEKDAYMMDRTFSIWRSVYTGVDTAKMVRVAGVQHAWIDNTRRILEYLFKDGKGCDAIAPAGYFNFEESQHKAWLAMNPADVKPGMIIDSVAAIYDSTSGKWTRESAKYARQYKVDYLVYEGGQHMQPYLQGDFPYNPAVWDAQIHPRMYDLYLRNFREHVLPEVNCKLFMAFSYVGGRKSRYGSWGSLENYAQLDDLSQIKSVAPKYAALLDAQLPRVAGIRSVPGTALRGSGTALELHLVGRRLSLSWNLPSQSPVRYRILRPDGSEVGSLNASLENRKWVGKWNADAASAGLYFVQAHSAGETARKPFFIP